LRYLLRKSTCACTSVLRFAALDLALAATVGAVLPAGGKALPLDGGIVVGA
jgi:hypothetical protein